jgi:hypothetical protein
MRDSMAELCSTKIMKRLLKSEKVKIGHWKSKQLGW